MGFVDPWSLVLTCDRVGEAEQGVTDFSARSNTLSDYAMELLETSSFTSNDNASGFAHVVATRRLIGILPLCLDGVGWDGDGYTFCLLL